MSCCLQGCKRCGRGRGHLLDPLPFPPRSGLQCDSLQKQKGQPFLTALPLVLLPNGSKAQSKASQVVSPSMVFSTPKEAFYHYLPLPPLSQSLFLQAPNKVSIAWMSCFRLMVSKTALLSLAHHSPLPCSCALPLTPGNGLSLAQLVFPGDHHTNAALLLSRPSAFFSWNESGTPRIPLLSSGRLPQWKCSVVLCKNRKGKKSEQDLLPNSRSPLSYPY